MNAKEFIALSNLAGDEEEALVVLDLMGSDVTLWRHGAATEESYDQLRSTLRASFSHGEQVPYPDLATLFQHGSKIVKTLATKLDTTSVTLLVRALGPDADVLINDQTLNALWRRGARVRATLVENLPSARFSSKRKQQAALATTPVLRKIALNTFIDDLDDRTALASLSWHNRAGISITYNPKLMGPLNEAVTTRIADLVAVSRDNARKLGNSDNSLVADAALGAVTDPVLAVEILTGYESLDSVLRLPSARVWFDRFDVKTRIEGFGLRAVAHNALNNAVVLDGDSRYVHNLELGEDSHLAEFFEYCRAGHVSRPEIEAIITSPEHSSTGILLMVPWVSTLDELFELSEQFKADPLAAYLYLFPVLAQHSPSEILDRFESHTIRLLPGAYRDHTRGIHRSPLGLAVLERFFVDDGFAREILEASAPSPGRHPQDLPFNILAPLPDYDLDLFARLAERVIELSARGPKLPWNSQVAHLVSLHMRRQYRSRFDPMIPETFQMTKDQHDTYVAYNRRSLQLTTRVDGQSAGKPATDRDELIEMLGYPTGVTRLAALARPQGLSVFEYACQTFGLVTELDDAPVDATN